MSIAIPGYLDDFRPPLVEAPRTELFWPTYLYSVGGSESAPEAFGADLADLSELVDRLIDPAAWPVISLPVRNGRLHVILRNLPDDSGVDYVIDLGAGALRLAALEGHFRGPALSWPELLAVAQQPDPHHTKAERLLLLLPARGDADRPSDAVEVVARALAEVGADPAQARTIAEELLDSPDFDPTDCPWTRSGDALVCLGGYALRTPGGELSTAELIQITRALS